MRTTHTLHHEKLSFSYLLIFGIVAFTKYSIYPWILIYLHSRTSLPSWGQAVLGYGLLLSTLYFGEYCGQSFSNSYYAKLTNGFYSGIFLLLTISYISVAFVSRFFMLVLLFWLIGVTGSILSSFSLNIDKRSFGSIAFLHFQRNSFDPNRQIERTITCFVFFTLVTAFLYDHSPHVEFPCYYLSTLLAVSCIVMLLYYCILQRTITSRKSPLSARLTAISSSNISFTSSSDSTVGGIKPATQSTEVLLTPADLAYAGDVPLNFLNACKGNIQKAREMYGKMLAWRRQYSLEKIFETPQHGFDHIARCYPHAIHGYSKDGCGIVYEILGQGRAGELAETGVTIDDIVWHFNLRNEVVFRYVLDPERLKEVIAKSPSGAIEPVPFNSSFRDHPNVLKEPVPRLMTVLDLKGISLSSFSFHVLNFLKKSSDTIDNYYPEQVVRIVILHVPAGFSFVWSAIKRVLPESVQQKVDFLSSVKELDKYIHPSQRPVEYGGTDVPLGQSDGHKYFLSCAEKWKSALTAPKNSETPAAESHNPLPSNNPAVSQNTKRGKIFNWISDRFRKVPAAYLGEKNTYKFNNQSGKWELDVEEDKTPLLSVTSADNSETEDSETEQTQIRSEKASVMKRNDSLDFAVAKSRPHSAPGLHSHHPSLPPPISISAANPAPISTPTQHQGKKRTGKTPKMSKDQLEEHGLVLAIHAAHFAKKISKNNGDLPISISSNQVLSRSESGAITANLSVNNMELGIGRSEPFINGDSSGASDNGVNEDDPKADETGRDLPNRSSNSSNNSNDPGAAPKTKLSGKIFLFVSFVFIVVSCIQSLVWTLLPVWFASPLRSGGLGFNVRDLGLLLSGVGVIILHFHLVFGSKAEFLLKASPVRALRIGCGIFFVSAFSLQVYLRLFTLPIEEALHHLQPLTAHSLSTGHSLSGHHGHHFHVQSSPDMMLEHQHHYSIIRSFQTSQETEGLIISHLSQVLPSISMAALLIPCSLIACMVSSLYLCRKAAGILFHLVLTSSFNSPVVIRSTLTTIAEVIGPFFSALLYSIVYSTRLRFPLDSSFFLSFSYSLVLIAYMLSLFLAVRFRGDFGIMPDDEQDFAAHYHANYYQPRYQTNSEVTSMIDGLGEEGRVNGPLHQRHLTNGNSSDFSPYKRASSRDSHDVSQMSHSRPKSRIATLKDTFLSVPLADMSLLFSSVGDSYSYGSKLYNLKDDFKDV